MNAKVVWSPEALDVLDDIAEYVSRDSGFSPMHCPDCNMEVSPARFVPDRDIVYVLAYSNHLYAAVHRLWLDSDAYEEWALAELKNIGSRVKVEGLAAVRS